MKQLIAFIQTNYEQDQLISGGYISLFNLQNKKIQNTIDKFEELVLREEYFGIIRKSNSRMNHRTPNIEDFLGNWNIYENNRFLEFDF